MLAGGGIDSTACIQQMVCASFKVRAMHISYGQPASELEWAAVQRIGAHFSIAADRVQVDGRTAFSPGEVLGRNAMFLSIATVFRRVEESLVCIGVHAGTRFYDCGSCFITEMSSLLSETTDGRVRVVAPLLNLRKADVVRYCREHRVPIHLTYSCQLGTTPPCGTCTSCKDREALQC